MPEPSGRRAHDEYAGFPPTAWQCDGIVVDAVSDALGERFDLARQPVVDRKVLSLGQNRVALEFEPSMAADHVLMASVEIRELNRLHLIEVHDFAPFALGLLESAVQVCELRIKHFIVGQSRSSGEGRRSFTKIQAGAKRRFQSSR